MVGLTPSAILDAFLAGSDGKGALAALRAPDRPLAGFDRGVEAFVTELAASCLRAVDRGASAEGRGASCSPRRLLQAAIAAAKSDRRLDAAGLSAIAAAFPADGADECAFLRTEVERPEMIDHITRDLSTREEMVEVYVVSRLAASANSPASAHYLQMLGARLGLERALTDEVDSIVGRSRR